MFQCHSPKSSHPHHLPQSPKDCSIYLCLFCCLTYNFMLKLNGWGIAFMNQQNMWFLEMKPISDKDAMKIIEITRFRIWYELCWLMAGFENTNYSSETRFTASKMFSTSFYMLKRKMISIHFQGKPFNIMVIQVHAPTSNAENLKLNGSMKTYKTF